MASNGLIRVGAVAYDPRVVPIWEGMRDYFREAGVPIDYVLYSNYDALVDALINRGVDIGWNTNLAYLKVMKRTGDHARVLAMRDVDANFTTVFVARTDTGVKSLTDVKGKRLALGSADSGQAAILPVHFLQLAGVDPDRDCTVLRFNLDVGKHGDTGTSELEALRALRDNEADVTALADATWIRETTEGRVDTRQIQAFWTSPEYCHCNFTVLPDFPQAKGEEWTRALLGMTYDNPRWRPLMDQEGLKAWIQPTLEGYRVLSEAVAHQRLDEKW
ncbi:MAG: phosphate ABC transporter substrate-binding protein [Armatimonadetes bacterium]|nr:phosphate ABC transporter substrate-binding protein [Armatimonadota bacterium]